jgi:hydroxymethylglutaryl-CoA lyase
MADIVVNDVVLRDGLQDEPRYVEVARRVELAEHLVAAGLRHLEVASFVNPQRVPQMAGAEELLAALPRRADVTWSAIALNARGAERAVAAGADDVVLVVSAGEGHSRANAGRMVEDAIAEFATWRGAHPDVVVSAGVSTAFVCPFDGTVPPARLVDLATRFADLGVHRLGLADTLGTADPELVLRSTAAVREALPDIELALHLHDAHGRALETVTAAIEAGITRFDSATGGYGGCPFAPGAHGNLATEQLVEHLHAAGHRTGIDPSALTDVVGRLQAVLADAAPV